MRKTSLKTKIGAWIIIIGVTISVVSCFVGYGSYKKDMEKYYNDQAYKIANLVSEQITPEQLQTYITTRTTDEKYSEITNNLQEIQKNLQANYIYIATQSGATLTYIFDTGNPQNGMPKFELGDTSTINPEFLKDSIQILKTGQRSKNYFYSESEFGYNTSAILPIMQNGKVIAIVGVELTMQGLQTMLKDYMQVVFIATPVAIIILLVVFSRFVKKRVITPIESIKNSSEAFTKTKQIQCGELASINTGDEIEVLAKSIYDMQAEIIEHVKNIEKVTSEKQRISAELGVAHNIQEFMLPPPESHPNKESITLHASMTPAKEVGGDFYDFFAIDETNIGLIVADVSGKGVPASLFMVVAKTMLKNATKQGLSPSEIFQMVNNELCENNGGEMFVTCWLGILNTHTGELSCVNAGHEYPALKRANGDFQFYKDEHGFVLAGMENTQYNSYNIKMKSGDMIFLYTDGIPEATNIEKQLYGGEQMLAKLNEHAKLSPKELSEKMLQDILGFTGEAEQFDDITMLCLKFLKNETPKHEKQFDISKSSANDIVEFCEEVMEEADVPSKTQIKMAIAIDELCANIFSYSGATDCKVEVQAEESEIQVTIKDNGKPYNPLESKTPNVTQTASERQIGGLGVFIVKNLATEMAYEYQDGENIIKMKIKEQK